MKNKSLIGALLFTICMACTSSQVQTAKNAETAVFTAEQIACVIPQVGILQTPEKFTAACKIAQSLAPYVKQLVDAILAYAAQRAALREGDAGAPDAR